MGSQSEHHNGRLDESSEVPVDMPVIDFEKLVANNTREQELEFQILDGSLRTYGFFYLTNHTIPQDVVDEAFQWAKRFFNLPVETKEKVAHPSSGAIEDHRGWAQEGLGYVTQLVFDADEVQRLRTSIPERKETLEMGNPRPNENSPPNRNLPEEDLPGFVAFTESWWDHCTRLQHSLLGILGRVLQLRDEELLSKLQTKDVCHVSMNFYPSTPIGPLKSRQAQRLNAHTDFGGLTLLLQDMVGGLEVHDGKLFKPVIPKRGTVVCNVGDMLERQTNGRWKSALHQVVAPTVTTMQKGFEQTDSVVDRYSIVYFGIPDPDAIIETLPGCEEPGKWTPSMVGDWEKSMTSAEWLQKRLEQEY
ncbi:thymine dioxygenase [Apiospora arundinis]|uniref:Thymine dioxygenase n=1 Tax=Apiospora arundinis TaxID=335852 RepID=A0ABR2I5G3_9PEZI